MPDNDHYTALPLIRQPDPFTDDEWLFEVKYDGFRSLAFADDGRCRLVSRKGKVYDRFRRLSSALSALPDGTILDGELVCIDEDGVSQFDDLMFANGPAQFFAFDILRHDGTDVRELPCLERKRLLAEVVDLDVRRLHYVDHVVGAGEQLFGMICERDMEGIIAKPAASPYREVNGRTPWIKIKNPAYTQAEDRGDLFNG